MAKCTLKVKAKGTDAAVVVCDATGGCTKIYDENGKEVTPKCEWVESFKGIDKNDESKPAGGAYGGCWCYVDGPKLEVTISGGEVTKIAIPKNLPTYYTTKNKDKNNPDKDKAKGDWRIRKNPDGTLSYVWLSYED